MKNRTRMQHDFVSTNSKKDHIVTANSSIVTTLLFLSSVFMFKKSSYNFYG